MNEASKDELQKELGVKLAQYADTILTLEWWENKKTELRRELEHLKSQLRKEAPTHDSSPPPSHPNSLDT